MLESLLRKPFQQLFVDMLLTYVQKYSLVTPNQVTLLSGIFGVVIFPTLLFGYSWLAVAALLLSGYCDVIDGSLARAMGQSSDVGTVLDIITDRCVEFIVIFALFCVAPEERGFACLLMLGSVLLCVTSFLVIGIFSQNQSAKSFHYSPGLMERPEAFCFFILMILFPHWFFVLAILFSLLIFWTAFWRLKTFVGCN